MRLCETVTDILIPFHDVDAMNITWHGHYAKYLEVARCELLDAIGYNYPEMVASGYSWPVIELYIRYAQPLRFRQTIQVVSWVEEYEHRLKIKYEIRDQATGRRLTKAYTTQAAVCLKTNEMCFESPAVLFERLGVEAPELA